MRSSAKEPVKKVVKELGGLNVLINNAAEQHVQEEGLPKISSKQLLDTFRSNIFSMFYLTKAALPYLKEGVIVSFTRSLAKSLVAKKIRVNAVAPGPIWTPLIPSTFPEDHVESFGAKVSMNRAGQPDECAPAYVFLACDDSKFMVGQVISPNGGYVI